MKTDLVKTLVKYLVLESCSNDMRTFLIEHKVSALTLEDFQELGVVYQEAYGKPIRSSEKSKKKRTSKRKQAFYPQLRFGKYHWKRFLVS